jgi:hypothetical protein
MGAGCGNPHAAAGTSTAGATSAVEQAYLSWWGARQGAYLKLDPGPLHALAAPAAVLPDEQRMAALRGDGHVLQLSAEHGTRTVVYRGGSTASVDDVWVDHSVELDPATMAPVQPDPALAVHESTTLRRTPARWVVDAVFRFGVSRQLPDEAVSWAAVAGGRPLPVSYAKPIEDAYLATQPPGAGHNDRVAIEQDSVAWVYDSVARGSSVTHTSTRLVQEGAAWKVQPSG